MRHRRQSHPSLLPVRHIIDPFGADQQRALCTVEGFDQQRVVADCRTDVEDSRPIFKT